MKRDNVKVKCYYDDCGYEWKYHGKAISDYRYLCVTCPRCMNKNYVEKLKRLGNWNLSRKIK